MSTEHCSDCGCVVVYPNGGAPDDVVCFSCSGGDVDALYDVDDDGMICDVCSCVITDTSSTLTGPDGVYCRDCFDEAVENQDFM